MYATRQGGFFLPALAFLWRLAFASTEEQSDEAIQTKTVSSRLSSGLLRCARKDGELCIATLRSQRRGIDEII